MGEYGQFCPVAKAAEVLDQRWTLLVIRELVAGSTRFNDIHRGVPRMSRTLLSRRLTTLVNQGLVERNEEDHGPVYRLTEAGHELHQVIEAIGRWGIRWMSSLSDQDLDPALLVWDMHRRVNRQALPDGRIVVELEFEDVAAELRRWWLLLTRQDAEVCDSDPGYATDVLIETPLRVLARVWRGDMGWNDALRTGDLQLRGAEHLRRQVQDWFQLSPFATVARPPTPSVPRRMDAVRAPRPALHPGDSAP